MEIQTAPVTVPPAGGRSEAPAATAPSTTNGGRPAEVVDLTTLELVDHPRADGYDVDLLAGFVEVRVAPRARPTRPVPPALTDAVRLLAIVVALVTWPALVVLAPVPDVVALLLVLGGWSTVDAVVRDRGTRPRRHR